MKRNLEEKKRRDEKNKILQKKHNPTHNYENNAKNKKNRKLEKGKILALGFLHPFSVSIVFCFAMSSSRMKLFTDYDLLEQIWMWS